MTTDNSKYFLPGAVILAGLFIAGAVYWNGSHPGQGGVTTTPNPTNVDVKNVDISGDPFIGKADAPITIAFWTDYQCPFCKSVEIGGVPQITTPPALPDIIKNYVDTGKVKIVFMDFSFLGQDSITDGLWGRAVWKLYPEKYFEWRTAMYKAQDAEGDQGFGDEDSVKKLTATIAGIDAAKVAADVQANSAAYQTAMNKDKTEGQKVGVDATPSFVIGTKLLKGAYPYENLKAAIDDALAGK